MLFALASGACTGHVMERQGRPAPATPAIETPTTPPAEAPPPRAPAPTVDDPIPAVPAPPPPSTCRAASGPAPLRRLNPAEYDNTVRDLLGDTSGPARAWPQPGAASGFDNSAQDQSTDVSGVELFRAAAEKLALAAATPASKIVPCDPAAAGCAATFIEAFGKRAYRRPLTADDRERLGRAFELGRASGPWAGVRLVIETALQSPHFLYRVELGQDARADGQGAVELGDHEVASRLSYFLWNTMPDAALFAAADAGALRTAAQVGAQVQRMLADPKARGAIANFHRQWLSFDLFKGATRDARAFPRYSAAVNASMVAGSQQFLSHVVLASERGDLDELFTATYGFANADTAPLLGLPAAAARGGELARVTLDPKQRAGVLTDLTLMASLAKSNQTAPVQRGLFVREHLLCQVVPAPPDDADTDPGPPDPRKTTRQQFSEHRESPACAGCHALMDPIGFGFEAYDALGQFRAVENGRPVDASGELTGTRASDGPFVGAVELAGKLARADETSDCLVRQWFRYALGRREAPADDCALDAIRSRFARTPKVRELIAAIATSPAFLSRPALATKGACNP